MKTVTLALSFAIFVFLSLFSGAHGAIGVNHVSSSIPEITDSRSPALHGSHLIWQAKGGLAGTASKGDDWEIFIYDITTEIITQLTDDAFDDVQPQTDGFYVVWQKNNSWQTQIFLSQLSDSPYESGERISMEGSANAFSPYITVGSVVWSRQEVGKTFFPKEVVLYNAETGQSPEVISTPGYNSGQPYFAGEEVFFEQEDFEGSRELYVYDLSDDAPILQLAPEEFTWPSTPKPRVLSRYQGTGREIFLYTEADGYRQISSNTLNNTSPVLAMNYIAWMAEGDILLADIDYTPLPPPKASAVTDLAETWFTASWSSSAGFVIGYVLDVSTDPDFVHLVSGFEALAVGMTTQYTVTGLTPGTTYYYRIRAVSTWEAANFSSLVMVTLPEEERVEPPQPSPPAGQDPALSGEALPFIYLLLL